MIKVFKRKRVASLHEINPRSSDITFRIADIQAYRLVIVLQGLESVAEESICRASVQIGVRLLSVLTDELVEVFHGLLELLGKEICHSPAEIKARVARPQVHGFFKVFERRLVLSRTAEGNSPVMICRSIQWIQAQRFVKIPLRTYEISKVVLSNAPEKVCVIKRGVYPDQRVEIVYRRRILSVNQKLPPPQEELVDVILSKATDWRQASKQPKNKTYRKTSFHHNDIHTKIMLIAEKSPNFVKYAICVKKYVFQAYVYCWIHSPADGQFGRSGK